jgi:hypothetical protein
VHVEPTFATQESPDECTFVFSARINFVPGNSITEIEVPLGTLAPAVLSVAIILGLIEPAEDTLEDDGEHDEDDEDDDEEEDDDDDDEGND